MPGRETDGTQESIGFPPGALEPARRLCAWRDQPPAISRSRAKICRRRGNRNGAVRDAKAELRLGDPGAARRQADQGEHRDRAVAAGLWHRQGLFGAAGERHEATGGAGRPRKPRPQPLYRGCGAAPRGRQFRCFRAGRAELGRRLSRRRGKGGGAVRPARPPQDDGRFPRRGEVAESAPRQHRQAWRGRLLLWRRRRQPAGGANGRGSLRRGAVLRRAAESRGRAQDQGADQRAIRRARQPHHRRLAGLRQGADRGQGRA